MDRGRHRICLMAGTNEELERGTAAVIEALRALIKRRGRTLRGLERELDLGNGTLRKIFIGRSDLRVRHVELLARALGVSFQELMAEACPAPQEPDGQPASNLRELIAEVMRNELKEFWRRHVIRLEGSGTLARVEKIEPE